MAEFKTNKLSPSERKMRGGYYTPMPLARFLAAWAIRTGFESVLEPSCGDGNFVITAEPLLKSYGQITAVELNEEELLKAQKRCSGTPAKIWIKGDFFANYGRVREEAPFDVVLGNPPFIRFQNFEPGSRDVAFSHLKKAGYHPTKLANAWCAFVQLSAELMRAEGRMALVLPAELLQVGYARELRDRLPRMFRDIILVTFDELVFPEIQQEVVLLLAEGRVVSDRDAGHFHTLRVKNGDDLLKSSLLEERIRHLPSRLGHPGMKWTSLFLEERQFSALSEVQRRPEVFSLSEYAQVDVGVVTGRNSFFVVSADDADRFGLNGFSVPTVGRTNALRSIVFSADDLEAFEAVGPSRMINLRGVEADRFSKPLREYIRAGEREGVHHGYKCSVRSRWYDVPSIYAPDAFLFRQIHHAPFLVANHANATATDTIHRVTIEAGVDRDLLCAASINSLTFAWAEVCGRSYGGGVLELEPREAEELPCLYNYAGELDVAHLDACLRAGDLNRALDHSDEVLLRRGLGLSKSDVTQVRSAWTSLRDRRQGRRRGSIGAP